MKQFLVFAFYTYYPIGGLGDVIESFNSFEDAKDFANTCDKDFVYIWDRINDVRTEIR